MLDHYRCPHPPECGGATWHWSERARLRCRELDEDAAERARREYEREQSERDRREQETAWSEIIARVRVEHQPQEPFSPRDAVLSRNGERQLLSLPPGHLSVIGLLTRSGIARVNRALRTGSGLDAECAADYDYEGFRSNRHFADTASSVFAEIGDGLILDEPLISYRGLAQVPEDVPALFDPEPAQFTDQGFMFGTTASYTARQYHDAAWSATTGRAGTVNILFAMEVHRAICIPEEAHRSQDLTVHLARTRQLDTWGNQWKARRTPLEDAMGQTIIPPGSTWIIARPPDQDITGTFTVHLRQND